MSGLQKKNTRLLVRQDLKVQSSIVRISSSDGFEASYQQTETGNLNTIKLEELLYDVGDNLVMTPDLTNISDFG